MDHRGLASLGAWASRPHGQTWACPLGSAGVPPAWTNLGLPPWGARASCPHGQTWACGPLRAGTPALPGGAIASMTAPAMKQAISHRSFVDDIASHRRRRGIGEVSPRWTFAHASTSLPLLLFGDAAIEGVRTGRTVAGEAPGPRPRRTPSPALAKIGTGAQDMAEPALVDHPARTDPHRERAAATAARFRFVTAASLFDGHGRVDQHHAPDPPVRRCRGHPPRAQPLGGGDRGHRARRGRPRDRGEPRTRADTSSTSSTWWTCFASAGGSAIRVFGGGGGVIIPEEVQELHAHGVTRIYSPEDGRTMGLRGMNRRHDRTLRSRFGPPLPARSRRSRYRRPRCARADRHRHRGRRSRIRPCSPGSANVRHP